VHEIADERYSIRRIIAARPGAVPKTDRLAAVVSQRRLESTITHFGPALKIISAKRCTKIGQMSEEPLLVANFE